MFGPFQLLPAQRLLLEDGKDVRLGTRAMDILVMLVERAGEVVSKEELVGRVWSRQFVEDANIRVHVGVLRKALADGTQGRRYIATIAGRGYSFVGEVVRDDVPAREDPRTNDWRSRLRLIRMIGRSNEVSEIGGHLSRTRLLTIAGPGGIGKTSVALAAANALAPLYENQVFFVDFSPLSDPARAAGVISSTIGLPILSEDPLPSLLRAIRGRRMLLVLDSCEHLIEAVVSLAEAIVSTTSQVSIIATSREPLRLRQEHVHRLQPLPVPREVAAIKADEAMGFASVQLFVQRVAAEVDGYDLRDAEAPIVSNICCRLDGIPLAIELAAGRVGAFGVQGVADQLDSRLSLLSNGKRLAIPRHQTLASAIDWSYNLLPADERIVLQKLSIFPGSFTLQSACAVAGNPATSYDHFADLVAALVGKSLVTADTERLTTEYRLLDTTRAYACEKLRASGSLPETQACHARYLKHLFEDAVAAKDSKRGRRWPADYHGQIDDLRAALTWSLGSDGDLRVGVALTLMSVPLWVHLSLVQECRSHVTKVLDLSGAELTSSDMMALYAALAMSEMYIGSNMHDLDSAWNQAMQLSERVGDEKYRARAIWGLSSCHILSGKLKSALSLGLQYHELATAAGDTGAICIGERLIGQAALYLGDFALARKHLEAVLYKYTNPSEKLHVLDQKVMAQSFLARTLWITGFPDQGRRLMQDVVEYARANGHSISLCMALSQSACHVSNWLDERQLFSESVQELLDCSQRYGLTFMRAPGLCYEGLLMVEGGRMADGLLHFQDGFEEFRRNSIGLFRDILCDLALVLCSKGEHSKATLAIDEARERFDRNGELWFYPECLRIKGEIKIAEGNHAKAAQHFRDAVSLASRLGALSWELRAATSLAKVDMCDGERNASFDQLVNVYSRFTEGFDTPDLRRAALVIEQWQGATPRAVVGMLGGGRHR